MGYARAGTKLNIKLSSVFLEIMGPKGRPAFSCSWVTIIRSIFIYFYIFNGIFYLTCHLSDLNGLWC